MMNRAWTVAGAAGMAVVTACGSRTGLDVYSDWDSGIQGASDVPVVPHVGPCTDGETVPCGSNVGTCRQGLSTCIAGAFGPCEGAVGPGLEVCNDLDDNCDGRVDEGFGIGEPCKGTGSNQCFDGVTTCSGCKKTGPEKVEVCNGVDDNCNGVIDSDCEVGDCRPSLLVTGSVPSSPTCINFPVSAGSSGSIHYPCGGGSVTATLGGIAFAGSVQNNFVRLAGTVTSVFPEDGCTWQMGHTIEGDLPSGNLSYFYTETVIRGVNCWGPCTESGTVKVTWVVTP